MYWLIFSGQAEHSLTKHHSKCQMYKIQRQVVLRKWVFCLQLNDYVDPMSSRKTEVHWYVKVFWYCIFYTVHTN